MTEENGNASLAKALVFFQKAEKVAATNNWDYAIDLYLEGLRCAPDEVSKGHMRLHELGLKRSVRGGKKPTLVEKMKRMTGKTPLEQMLNAEYLFVKDPDNISYAEAVLKASLAGDYRGTARWIADFLFSVNNEAEKPSFSTYVLLKDSYVKMGELQRALAACQRAVQLKPTDGEMSDELRRLSAEVTMSSGKYDQDGDFRKSIKDREKQEQLHAQEGVVKSDDYRMTAVEGAIASFRQNPDLAKNIFGLAQALSDIGTDTGDNDAIKVLEHAYQKQKDFGYKLKAGEIRVKQLKRHIRHTREELEKNPQDDKLHRRLSELTGKLNQFETEHFRISVENYPTDLPLKYEYAVRLMRQQRYDEAIPLFQESQRDPKYRFSSMGKIGLCFFNKGWYTDAIDVFTQAIDQREIKDDGLAKEMRYNLARSYEEQGEVEQALELFRRLAQQDFGYKDVRERVDKLRTE